MCIPEACLVRFRGERMQSKSGVWAKADGRVANQTTTWPVDGQPSTSSTCRSCGWTRYPSHSSPRRQTRSPSVRGGMSDQLELCSYSGHSARLRDNCGYTIRKLDSFSRYGVSELSLGILWARERNVCSEAPVSLDGPMEYIRGVQISLVSLDDQVGPHAYSQIQNCVTRIPGRSW